MLKNYIALLNSFFLINLKHHTVPENIIQPLFMERKNFLKFLALLPLSTYAMKLKEFGNTIDNLSATEQMPVLFLGHGSPMNAIEQNQYTESWKTL